MDIEKTRENALQLYNEAVEAANPKNVCSTI